jgi:preprotein translocase subunit SecD
MNDDLELRLRAAVRGPLPAAPSALLDALETITAEPVASPRRVTTSWWGLLGVAAVLAAGAVAAISIGSRDGQVPLADASPSASAVTSPAASGTPATSPSAEPTVLTFEARPKDGSEVTDGLMDELVALLRGRFELAGVAGVTVERSGPNDITVDRPLSIEAEDVRALIEPVGEITIVPLGSEPVQPGDALDPARFPALLGPESIGSAEVAEDQDGNAVLLLRLTDEATPIFADYSADHVGEYFALLLDGEVLVVPTLLEAITGGEIELAAGDGWERDDLERLAAIVNVGGPLGVDGPDGLVPVPFVEQSTVPADGD